MTPPDAQGNVDYLGAILDGEAKLQKQGKSGGEMNLHYTAPVSGTLNLITGALTVLWAVPTGIGDWDVTSRTDGFVTQFAIGETGMVTATADTNGHGPEKGSVTFFGGP